MEEKQFECEEFKESYAHYRHLEEERSRHLALFLALVGAFFGFLGFLVQGETPTVRSEWSLFLCGMMVAFLQFLDTVTFVAIRRVGDARAVHAKTLRHLRAKLTTDRYVADLWNDFERRTRISVQSAVDATLPTSDRSRRLRVNRSSRRR